MILFSMVQYFQIFLIFCGSVHLLTAQILPDRQVFTERLMGTDVKIMVDAIRSDSLNIAFNAAFMEGKRLNMVFSDWDAESEVSRFSRTSQSGQSFALSAELSEILSFSQRLAHKSNGAFDVTIGPLSRLWRMARHQKKVPDSDKVQAALKRTGYQKLQINESNTSGRLITPGMVLDLGGVAKGYIADQMLRVMKEKGFPRCLIDAGGDLTIGDPPRACKGWKVSVGGISNTIIPSLELSNCAVATSGDMEQFLEFGGKRFSHLIDPRTGFGVEGKRQVTVIAENGMTADAYASTCLILGASKAGSLLSELSYFRIFYLTENDLSEGLQIFELHSSSNE